jgi:hypothetical protein
MTVERKSFKYKLPEQTPLTKIERKESEMRLAFSKKAEEILGQEGRFIKKPGDLRVGLEVEYSVLSKEFSQATELCRDQIVKSNPDFTDVELGAAQLEWRTNPLYLNQVGLNALENIFIVNEGEIKESAREQDVYLLRTGSNPFVLIPEIKRTDKTKYQQVPDYHNDNKRWGLDTKMGVSEDSIVDVRDATIIALTNSIQCNLEASIFEDAIDKTNRSFAIGPMAVALASNARFLEEKDTGIADIRMIAWEKSHDTRTALETEQGKITRIGLPGLYYLDLRDYFQRVPCYPFILHDPEHAFQIGIGLNWRDTRIKFIEDSVVVEFRPVSTQSTVKENIAIMLFYLGRLQWSSQHKEPLLDLKLVEQNRDQAMYFGLNSKLWTHKDKKTELLPAEIALDLELKRAVSGLKSFGFSSDDINYYFEVLHKHLAEKESPSDKLAQRFYKYYSSDCSKKESLILALDENGSFI